MRLIIVLFILGIMQVSAATYAQQFSLNRKNISIKEVFKQIKNQTGYDVLYQPEKLDANRIISVDFKHDNLKKVIDYCIAGKDLAFEIEDNTIVIKAKQVQANRNVIRLSTDSIIYHGTVLDEKGIPMPGATVRVKGSNKMTKTTSEGNFAIYGPKKGALEISYISYITKEFTLTGVDPGKRIVIKMTPGTNNLGEVNIVSTGYQDLPKERATGSFEVITQEQLQHSTDPDLLRRLEGITTSMNFNNQLIPTNSTSFAPSTITNLTIRGRNTLNVANNSVTQSGEVLVVIDGIPSPYSIDKINPNDVESITVLKDAAAASIWGSRAANGVIVVKTKKGAYNRPLNISFNSNVIVSDKFNLFYKKKMTTSEFIDAQVFAFNASGTSINPPNLSQAQVNYSPVATILDQEKKGNISAPDANAQIDALRGNDIRNDYTKYLLRNPVTQSYSLALDGGTEKMTYHLSGGYDNTINNTIASAGDRLALNYFTSVKVLKNLELTGDLTYNRQRTTGQAGSNIVSGFDGNTNYYPYTRIVDSQGNPIPIPYKYSTAFLNLLNSTYGNNILNLQFNPLYDIYQGYNKTDRQGVNIRLGANYQINPIFSVNVAYNLNHEYDQQIMYEGPNSFYTRNLVDIYNQGPNYQDPNFGSMPYENIIPQGGIYQPTVTTTDNQILRGQVNANKTWNGKHVLNAIAGAEITQSYTLTNANQYYGYYPNTLSTKPNIDYYNYYTWLFADAITGLPFGQVPGVPAPNFSDYRLRTYSYFSNAAYTYNNRYTLSGSIRKDVSSDFGYGENNNGTPFYSMGASWNIANEDFYHVNWLPKLQLRATFGYNGNVNNTVGPSPLITYNTAAAFFGNNNLPYASSNGVTNADLRPEKTAVLNFGLDFGLRNNRISGSLEYYDKKTTDLISGAQVDPTTGFSSATYNIASLHGWGTDLTLNSRNIQSGPFSWTSTFLFSYNRVKVSKYSGTTNLTAAQLVQGATNFTQGYDVSRLFAFRWAGLDPNTGDPRGYLNGVPTSVSNTAQGNANAAAIENQPGSTAHYLGSAVPVYYGSLRNTFSYKRLSLSANILYKLGYYFFRPSSDVVSYSALLTSNSLQGIEYEKRWQKPGDELRTNVPSLTYPASQIRDTFYALSDINVLKADHVRLQEVNLSYLFGKKSWFIKNPRIFASVTNLGVIWRANKLGLDPDINDYPKPRTYSLGLNANF
ncbi:TonB-linked SusC/RagA family outer membrane protein [Pedobacter cryoconitis]|uniref:TonB-linked SusC/RagA family outer membrane protein n=2 Tax=Pedobacter cryoconitis TaxID=188932 RepID=A0A7X0J5T8_9SPHI|nr:TonB-linked SusC/RagA family outer membrane protein [Pedobacter cryoconitis]